MSNVSKSEIRRALWERGILKWKFHKVQLEMYNTYLSADPNSTLVWLLARQSGKSFALATLAIETCLSKPNAIVKLLTDTKIHVESIYIPLFAEIFADCPEHLRPSYEKTKYVYTFPNGSQIQLAGSDNGHYERLRGQKTDLVLVDEAGFCSNLRYIVESVLFPTTTHTGGKIIMASTPPEDAEHEFTFFIEKAEMDGTLTKKTVFDNPLLTEKQVQNIIQKLGGANSIAFRREYLCEIIRDETNVVFPEASDEHLAEITAEWHNPSHFDSYVGMDLGGSMDLTAVLYGYYDFMNDKIIIQDEIVFSNKDKLLPTFVKEMEEKERSLWTNSLTNEFMQPHKRVSDINYIATQEIARLSLYQIIFSNAQKDDKDTAIKMVRTLIAQKKIIISPKCVKLLSHIKNCKWKKSTTGVKEFARSPDDGHYDAVMALVYMVRAMNFKKNPYPPGYEMNLQKGNFHVRNPEEFMDTYYGVGNTVGVFRKVFNKK